MLPDDLTFPPTSTLRRSLTALVVSAVLLVAPTAFGQDPLQVISDQGVTSIKLGERPVAVYQCEPRPRKPYVKELFSPRGVNVLRDAPADHLHHHGLMFAVAVDGVDFWSERDNCGHEKHVRLTDVSSRVRDGASWCTFTHGIDWVGPDAKTLLLKERRTIDVCRTGDPTATLLIWNTSLAVPLGKESATLTGSAYFGLGMRFVASMDTGGRFTNAEGNTGVEGTNEVRSRWCAYSAAVEGKPVTVAMFDCPGNPRHPATWFTMDSPFAYLAATLGLDRKPLVIASAEPLELRYAVALWDGRVTPEKIDRLYEQLPRWPAGPEKP